MKKLILAIAMTASTVAFLSCSKHDEELKATAMLSDMGRANFYVSLELSNRNTTDKANLAQADYNAN